MSDVIPPPATSRLALVQHVHVRVGCCHMAVPIDQVQQALPLPPQAPAGWGMGNWMHELVDGRPVHGGEGPYALDEVPVRIWWPEHLAVGSQSVLVMSQ